MTHRITHKYTKRNIPSILLFAMLLLGISHMVFAQDSETQVNTQEEISKQSERENQDATGAILIEAEESELGSLLFSVKADLYTSNEIVDDSLYKGTTLFWDAKQDTRYAVIASSDVVDTLVRLAINNVSVYSDLYLGEDAGVVFTPKADTQMSLTVFSIGRLDGSLRASEIQQARLHSQAQTAKQDERGSSSGSIKTEEPQFQVQKIGDYVVEVYQLPSLPKKLPLPANIQGELNTNNLIAHRSSIEYRVNLPQDKRVYVLMHSTEFDSLLELSDRLGRKIISDDWGDNTSLITLEVPSSDEYYITATSFDGRRNGAYDLQATVSENEQIEEIIGQITPASSKVLQKYASERALPLSQGNFMTAVVQALDNDIEVAFVKDSFDAIHVEKVLKGETKIIPLYAKENANYKLLMLSEQKIISNYILTLFK